MILTCINYGNDRDHHVGFQSFITLS